VGAPWTALVVGRTTWISALSAAAPRLMRLDQAWRHGLALREPLNLQGLARDVDIGRPKQP